MRITAALLAPVVAWGCAGGGSGAAPGADATPAGATAAAGTAADRIYVTNQDDASVAIIDATSLEVVKTVDLRPLGFGDNARPHHAVVEPDGSAWYVSLIGEARVLKFDADDRLVGQAEFEVPGMLALDPGSDRLFVGRSMTAVNPPQRIGVVRRTDMSVEELSVLFPRPHALIANPRSVHAYTASLATNQMASVDPVEEHVRVMTFDGRPITMEHDHAGHDMNEMVHTLVDFAMAPDGRVMVGTGEMTGTLLTFDLSDPAAPRLTNALDVGPRPYYPGYSPDGRWVWIPTRGDDAVRVVDTRTWTVDAVVRHEAIAEPHMALVAPDGRHAFVSSSDTRAGGNGRVVVIDTRTREVVKVLEVGRNPTGMGARGLR